MYIIEQKRYQLWLLLFYFMSVESIHANTRSSYMYFYSIMNEVYCLSKSSDWNAILKV